MDEKLSMTEKQVPVEEQMKDMREKLQAIERYLGIRVSYGTHYVKREETW